MKQRYQWPALTVGTCYYPSETEWHEVYIDYNYKFNVDVIATDVTCFEAQNGTVSVSVTGGSGDYSTRKK